MNRSLPLLIAGALAAVAVVLHEVVGAPIVLPPLRVSGLPQEVIALHQFSWHVGSIATGVMSLMFIRSGLGGRNRLLGQYATYMASGMALLALVMAVSYFPSLWTTPAPYIWSVIGLLGWVGWMSRS